MEFGKTDLSQLANINFALPPDPPANGKILSGLPAASPKVYVGCARWGTKNWLGHFYPEHTKEKDFLLYYAKLFNCVELSTTYYHVPTAEQVKQWKSKVNKDFRFCPKFPQYITHVMRLQNCDREVAEFINSIYGFEDNLGPVFLMPHPHMGIHDLPVLRRFIERLPDDFDVYLELRNPGWFLHGFCEPLFDLAATYEVGLVITDVAGRRDCVHMRLSKPETFIRFVGNDLHPTDYSRVADWAARIRQWIDNGMQKVYFMMHQPTELNVPLLNADMINQLNASSRIQLPAVKSIQPQATLFD